ncbi:MAG TPA: Hsp20/alpha crystallin family protein [Candidatus Dormibacteraeota bacterium]|nr:Hsp20/alpha crystallin family protein [Candidatus Dormibacteraeota bacterium]
MLEKSAAAVQTAPSHPRVKAGKIENLTERINRLSDDISRRAFELFEQDGRVHGHDLRHWLEAEQGFLHPMCVNMEETKADIVVHAEVPGFTASDLEVDVEPRRVTITGKRETKMESKKGEPFHTEVSRDELFRTFDLPSEVNAAKVVATLKDGILDIQLPKAEAKKSVSAAQRAA